jgi:hypothetical protein
MDEQNSRTIIITPTKSVGVSLLLTFFFGPLGLLYSTISGAIVMFIICFLVGIVTFGIGCLITWPICMIWGVTASNAYNKKIVAAVANSK